MARDRGRIEVLYHVHAIAWCSEVVLIMRSRNGEPSRVILSPHHS